MVVEEFSRNVALWGEACQDSLERFSAGIIGATPAAYLLTVCLLSLGVGKVLIVDNARAGKKSAGPVAVRKGASLVKAWETHFNSLFPLSETVGYHSPPLEAVLYREMPHMLFDLSANPRSNAGLAALARRYRVPLYTGMLAGGRVMLVRGPFTGETSLSVRERESPLDGILAALCAEEARKHAFILPSSGVGMGDSPLSPGETLCVAPLEGCSSRDERRMKKKRVLLAGAGALGMMAALALSAGRPLRMDIYDPDSVEASNLNRQFIYRGHEGEKKASVLADELSRRDRRSDIRAFGAAVDDALLAGLEEQYDVVLSCVDTISGRMALSRYAAERRVPLLNCGTSSLGGTLQAYIPGKTACLSCQAGLEALLDDERRLDEERGCAAASPSVIMPNMAMGSLMALYAGLLLDGEELPASSARYHSFSRERLSFEERTMLQKDGCPWCV